MTARVAIARLVVPRGNEIGVDPRSPGTETVGEVPHPRLTYRPELDGIRGIAILAVLAAHSHLTPEVGRTGLVGVNLFFVLSGYLITGLLLAERAKTGRVSFRAFYERRARRLLPALIALVGVAGVVAAVSGQGGGYPTAAVTVLLYVGNVARAAGLDLGYLGHTWSLALEEQFYFLWPAVFVFAPRRWLVPGLLLAIVGSIAAQWLTQADPLAPNRPDVRADAILWGCLIALRPLAMPRIVTVMAWLGLAGLAVSAFQPLPMAATSLCCAIAVAGAAPGILSSRLLVRAGQISYGLYLWHWIPAFALWDATAAGNLVAITSIVLFAFAAALISERWIERPFRRRRQGAVRLPPVPLPA